MTRSEKIDRINEEIKKKEARLEKQKSYLKELTNSYEYTRLMDIKEFPKTGPLMKALIEIAGKIESISVENVTVGHLIRMNAKEISKKRGVGIQTTRRVEKWMEVNRLNFMNNSKITYIPISEDELLSEFNRLWEDYLYNEQIMTLYDVIAKRAKRKGKEFCYTKSIGYRGVILIESCSEGNYTVGDFLQENLRELQKEGRFSNVLMNRIKKCIEVHGLNFIRQ